MLLTVCGEMGGRQVEALALLGWASAACRSRLPRGPIKDMVRQVNLPEIEAEMNRLLDEPPANLREEMPPGRPSAGSSSIDGMGAPWRDCVGRNMLLTDALGSMPVDFPASSVLSGAGRIGNTGSP
jgi:hypothetical protein